MVEYELRIYDIQQDYWDEPMNKQELVEALADDNMEVWLYRHTDSHGLTDTAEVKDYKLPEEGYKVPRDFTRCSKKFEPAHNNPESLAL